MCGIMGYVGFKDKGGKALKLNLALFSEISRRGMHASGYMADGKVVKSMTPSYSMALSDATKADFKMANVIMGHARYATHGSPLRMENNHPHVAGEFVLVHNGVIAVKPAGIKLESECDSEILVRVIERAGGVQQAHEEILGLEGSLAILCWDGKSLWFLRNEGSPGCWAEHGSGLFVASTKEIMMDAAKGVGVEITQPRNFKAGVLYRLYLK